MSHYDLECVFWIGQSWKGGVTFICDENRTQGKTG